MMRELRPEARRLSGFELEWPTDWSVYFGQTRELILEIGFGRGEYLLHLARRHPEANVIGVEVSNHSLDAMERRLLRGEASNVRIVHSSAEMALHHAFDPASLTAIHINFPDPWFKKRHQRRRVMQRDTLDAMVSRLACGGHLNIATDIRDYAVHSASLLSETPGLDNRLGAPWTHSISGRTPTKYEQRGLAQGRRGHYFAYRRNAAPAPDVPVSVELNMPHIGLDGSIDLDTVVSKFETMDIEGECVRASALGAYRGKRSVLFEVFVQEPTVSQRVAIVLRVKEDGRGTLGLSQLGLPRPTPGIHHVVARLSEWIASVQPGVTVSADRVSVARSAIRGAD